MSFTEKFVSLMARPNQQGQIAPQDDFPWYMKYGARVLGIIGAGFAMLFGLWNMIGVITGDLGCLIFGAFQICSGLLVMLIESPCCFVCAEQFSKAADMADSRPLWQRAALYCGVAVVPVIFCFSLASLFPGLLLFGTGALYGMMGLGKKASQDDMAAMAAASPNAMSPGGQMPPMDQRSTLMEDPDFDSPNYSMGDPVDFTFIGQFLSRGESEAGGRASREDMLNNAQSVDNSRPIGTTSGNRSNLVSNAQPISFTGPPAYDSNV